MQTTFKVSSGPQIPEEVGVLIWAHEKKNIWWFPKIGVPPNHQFLVGLSLINHLFWGTPIAGTPHIFPSKNIWTPNNQNAYSKCFGEIVQILFGLIASVWFL